MWEKLDQYCDSRAPVAALVGKAISAGIQTSCREHETGEQDSSISDLEEQWIEKATRRTDEVTP